MQLKRTPWLSCTAFFIFVCTVLFLWNGFEAEKLKSAKGRFALIEGITPLQKDLLFDYPKSIALLDAFANEHGLYSLEDLNTAPLSVQKQFQRMEIKPFWGGIVGQGLFLAHTGDLLPAAPMFEKIREGQVWRLFTPTLLHRDLLHILFNMGWLLLLGYQVEKRIKAFRTLILIVTLGIFSNIAQYLMGGPYFLGFSGVVVGLAGFIWSRQKVAPEEEYPLQRPTAMFIFYFVMVMALIGLLAFILQALSVLNFAFPIANTAHISGGLAGLFLGRCNFFARREYERA